MPRTAAGVTVAPIAPERLRPPPELAAAARSIFVELVASVAPDHFRVGDLPLVVAYAEAIATHREAVSHLRSEGLVVDGRPSAWFLIQGRALEQMAKLSMRLRLAPQSRARTRLAPVGKASYYGLTEPLEDEDAPQVQ
jgi:phage terminase small subunit